LLSDFAFVRADDRSRKPRPLAVFLVISLTLSAMALLVMPAHKRTVSRLDGASVEAVPIAQY
jgi:hypothetical protein